jgi:predicted acetyltransferase
MTANPFERSEWANGSRPAPSRGRHEHVSAHTPEIRPATADEFPAICQLLGTAFGQDMAEDEVDRERLVFEPDRDLVVVDGGEIVGNAGAYTRELTLPGGVAAPAAHVTLVSVRPTYRRRGLLTRLMTRQLADVRAAGESIAVLWASEGRIYHRYGYGMATVHYTLEIDTREVRLPPPAAERGPEPGRPAGDAAPSGVPAGRLRDSAPSDARKEMSQVYERVRLARPGWSSRDDRWWEWVIADPPSRRRGANARRALLFEGPDGVDGYALWRQKLEWSATGANGEAYVLEVVAATAPAYHELWRFLIALDLTRTVRYWYAATDEPLLHLVNEPRRLGGHVGDGLWVRLVDVAGALAARRYAAPVDVVIEVSDALLPHNAGRWRLSANGAEVTCTPSAEPAALACDVAALGAAYLGGTPLSTLAAAGRVRELRPGALAAATIAFASERAPSAIEVF